MIYIYIFITSDIGCYIYIRLTLVGGLEHESYDFPNEFHHPNWRSPFFRGLGRKTTNQSRYSPSYNPTYNLAMQRGSPPVRNIARCWVRCSVLRWSGLWPTWSSRSMANVCIQSSWGFLTWGIPSTMSPWMIWKQPWHGWFGDIYHWFSIVWSSMTWMIFYGPDWQYLAIFGN